MKQMIGCLENTISIFVLSGHLVEKNCYKIFVFEFFADLF